MRWIYYVIAKSHSELYFDNSFLLFLFLLNVRLGLQVLVGVVPCVVLYVLLGGVLSVVLGVVKYKSTNLDRFLFCINICNNFFNIWIIKSLINHTGWCYGCSKWFCCIDVWQCLALIGWFLDSRSPTSSWLRAPSSLK